MNISAILVVVPAADVAAATARLEALPGVEVRHRDPETGRLLVLQEAPTVDAEVAGLKRIKALPGVVLAEMVYHYFEDDPEIGSRRPPEAAAPGAPTSGVPAFLED